jgi:hypothetical protein
LYPYIIADAPGTGCREPPWTQADLVVTSLDKVDIKTPATGRLSRRPT